MLTRPKITEEILSQIQQIIAENPDWGRRRISIYLCELWDWRVPGGQLKDISCRDMLRVLDRAGTITLPAPKTIGQSPLLKINHQEHNTESITNKLSELRPLIIDVVVQGSGDKEFKSLIDQYHYLGYDRTVGENMKYLIRSKNGSILACLLFGSAAWKCRDRDSFIGWDQEQRTRGLSLMTNNVRFLVVPWVKVPHLASHILSIISRRISSDWEKKYGHPLHCLETFVERGRFVGSCYKAANWNCVGTTTGRGRNDRKHLSELPKKDIYLYPLNRRWREYLLGESEKSEEGGTYNGTQQQPD